MNTSPGKTCVAIAAATVAEALRLAQIAEPRTDVIEIRLDLLAQPAITPFVKGLAKPVLFTNRAQWEGGRFTGTEEARLDLLHQAVSAGASFIDIELKTDTTLQQRLLQTARGKCQTIISWHDFSGTPSKQALHSIFQAQYRSGAEIGKIVTMATSFQDVLRVLDLQAAAAEVNFPLIAFCMGAAGMISRVATVHLGGFMTYAAPDEAKGTAPGQLPISSLQTILAELGHAV